MRRRAQAFTAAVWGWRHSRFRANRSIESKLRQCAVLNQTEPERDFQMKLPSNSKIEYEVLGGDGIVAMTDRGFRLIKGSPPALLWRNFEIVPKQFAVQ
jgi:hypothetical protein